MVRLHAHDSAEDTLDEAEAQVVYACTGSPTLSHCRSVAIYQVTTPAGATGYACVRHFAGMVALAVRSYSSATVTRVGEDT